MSDAPNAPRRAGNRAATASRKPGNRPTSAPGPRSKPGLQARRLAAGVVARVLEDRQPLDAELELMAEKPAWATLPAIDRALVRALVGITIRKLGLIDDALRSLMDRALPDKAGNTRTHLRIGAAQILFMDIADHAAVSIAVDLVDADPRTRTWKGMVNAVLRNLIRGRDEILAGQDATRQVIPLWLWRRWTATYGEEATRAIGAGLLVDPPLDLTVKADPALWAERLGGTLLPTGSIRLGEHGPIEELDGFVDGAWWVQDAAAAMPARLLGDIAGQRVADLCAAPGGKTAQLAAKGAIVTAVDQSANRLKRLAANLGRLRLDAETITADLTEWTPAEPFDAILLDAPCSATGTLRRNPDVGRVKSPDDIAKLATIQADILARTVDWLKPGGTLVYCTCSLEPEEGTAQIERLLAARPDLSRRPISAEEVGGLIAAIDVNGDLRTMPSLDFGNVAGCDGFFASRIVRAAV